MSHLIGNRNSTPDGAASAGLQPPQPRNFSGHHLRASADMVGFGSSSLSGQPLSARTHRPTSEVYYNQPAGLTLVSDDAAEIAAQQWLSDIDQYETTLDEMAAATMDQDFKEELGAIEQWFRVLQEPERTASLYALLQQTTQVQIRFFIQVLQQMAKNNPVPGALSPASFDKDAMSTRMSDAMSKLNIDSSRNSWGLGSKPPSSPGPKRTSNLDSNTINSMFPDAAAAIAKQKADYREHTGNAPPSNRSSTVIGDRSSIGLRLSPQEDGLKKESSVPMPPSPWNARPNENLNPRPKSSMGHQPMGHFSQPPLSAGLRSPRPMQITSDTNLQKTTLTTSDPNQTAMPMLSPYQGGSWASMVNTPMVSNFNPQQNASQVDMVANATAMKLAALSTVNNRIQLDDARKYRRARSTEGRSPHSAGFGMGQANILMTNELGQVLTPQQAAALQAQQLAAMHGGRSRPSSPGIAIHSAGLGGMSIPMSSSNGFLQAYDANLLNAGLMGGYNSHLGGSFPGEGYLSDHSEARGRSPRGRRGTSKPPEDPTDPALLNDIPGWLRTLRLHKYTDNLKDMKWQDLVILDDDGLERRGVNALGARRKLLKVFEQVREAQGDGKL